MRLSRRCHEQGSKAAAPRCGGSTSAMKLALKKTLYAAEQKRAEVIRARRRWMREQGMFDPARLVFIDETWTNTAMVRPCGRSPIGERLVDYAPHGHWKIITCRARVDPVPSQTEHARMPDWPRSRRKGPAPAPEG